MVTVAVCLERVSFGVLYCSTSSLLRIYSVVNGPLRVVSMSDSPENVTSTNPQTADDSGAVDTPPGGALYSWPRDPTPAAGGESGVTLSRPANIPARGRARPTSGGPRAPFPHWMPTDRDSRGMGLVQPESWLCPPRGLLPPLLQTHRATHPHPPRATYRCHRLRPVLSRYWSTRRMGVPVRVTPPVCPRWRGPWRACTSGTRHP